MVLEAKRVVCRQCKKEIKTQLINCITCDKVFHPSCHKLHKVYNSERELITCPGRWEILTIKGTASGEGAAAKGCEAMSVDESHVERTSMESKIDWLMKKITDEMFGKNEIRSLIMDTIKVELESFKKEMEDMMRSTILASKEVPRSYSEVVNAKKKENVILVKPKEQQESEKTKKAVKQNIDIKNMPIGVSKMRKVGKGALILGCESEQELKQLKATVENKIGDKYQITEPKKIYRKVKIFNVDEEEMVEDEERVVNMIIKQNHLVEERSDFHMKIIKKIMGKRNENSGRKKKKVDGSMLIEADEVTHEDMIRMERINVGWRKCRVVDFVNVKRCFNCWGFYHIARNCKRPITCPKCAGSHVVTECKADKEKCVNCMYKNRNYNLKINEEHNALNGECPTLKKALEEEKKKAGWRGEN